MSSTVWSQQCCEVYFIPLAVAKPLWDLTTKYYWNRPPPLTLLAGSATAVAHIVSACSEIAGSLYKARHNNVAAAIHHSICQNYEIKMTDNIWLHKPNSVAEKNIVKVLWDFEIRTNRQIQARIPDLVVIDKQTKERLVIDVAIPNDTHIVDKEREKIETRAWG